MGKNGGVVFLSFLLLATIGFVVYLYWPGMISFPQSLDIRMVTITKEVMPAVTSKTDAVLVPLVGPLTDPFSMRAKVTRRDRKKTAAEPVQDESTKESIPLLEGIWVDSSMKVAFISGQAINEGGQIMGWRVVRIDERSVTIKKGSRRKILKLGVD